MTFLPALIEAHATAIAARWAALVGPDMLDGRPLAVESDAGEVVARVVEALAQTCAPALSAARVGRRALVRAAADLGQVQGREHIPVDAIPLEFGELQNAAWAVLAPALDDERRLTLLTRVGSAVSIATSAGMLGWYAGADGWATEVVNRALEELVSPGQVH